MSDYFYAPQNDLAAVIGGATRGLATALAGRPIWQAQARETGARAALYGAQTGYYQTKTQIEREQERRLSNLIISSAPDLANWASGKDVSPDGQQRINTMMLEAARADPNAFLQVPQLAADALHVQSLVDPPQHRHTADSRHARQWDTFLRACVDAHFSIPVPRAAYQRVEVSAAILGQVAGLKTAPQHIQKAGLYGRLHK